MGGFTGTREYVNLVKIVQELDRVGLSEEEILLKVIQAKSHPNKVVEVQDYKFCYREETRKFEDNRISYMINRVLEGDDPQSLLSEEMDRSRS